MRQFGRKPLLDEKALFEATRSLYHRSFPEETCKVPRRLATCLHGARKVMRHKFPGKTAPRLRQLQLVIHTAPMQSMRSSYTSERQGACLVQKVYGATDVCMITSAKCTESSLEAFDCELVFEATFDPVSAQM